MAASPQYWVVNNSPPGSGPGGAAFTRYAIVRGTFDQAAGIPNAGGVSGPYNTLPEAYAVWKAEPQNKDTSTLTTIGQAIGSGVGFAIYGASSPAGIVSAGKAGGQAANAAGNWLQDIGHWIGEFVTHFLDAAMWRSILWVGLGAVMLILGIYLFLKQQQLLPETVPVPV